MGELVNTGGSKNGVFGWMDGVTTFSTFGSRTKPYRYENEVEKKGARTVSVVVVPVIYFWGNVFSIME